MKNSFRSNCNPENLHDVREFVRRSLENCALPEMVAGDLVLALDEMCSNLMIHGHRCNPDHVFELVVDTSDRTKVIFELTDDSIAFDVNLFSEPPLGEIIHEKRKGGLGIRLVKSIMDEIQYFERNGKNVCRMMKMTANQPSQ